VINKNEIIRIVKFIFSASSSFILDLFLFTIINNWINNIGDISIIVATVIARILSSLYNFFINANFVFCHKSKSSLMKYFALVVTQMFISAAFVYFLNLIFITINDTILKFMVDFVLFVANYIIQKKVIFK